MKHFWLFSLLLATVVCAAQAPVPELPQLLIDTTFSPLAGKSHKVRTSDELKTALETAVPGDTIVLDANATFTGNFTLPAKPNPGKQWIYLVSSQLASLPVEGARVNPDTDAAHMPKLVTPNAQATLNLPPGANHYRLAGLEVSSSSNEGCGRNSGSSQNCFSYQLISAASVPGSPLVDSVVVDRCYIHGSPTQDVRRGVQANGSNFAVVDSYISDIHHGTNDSQAIAAWFSPGPIKIANNFLSATTEDVLFGGAGGLDNPWVPSDIEVRGNHFFKSPDWAQVGVTLPPKNQWVVKNHLEFKSARRALVEGNLLENLWVSGQSGVSVLLTPRTNQSGNLGVVNDITVRGNVLRNVVSGFVVLPWDNACIAEKGCTNRGETRRVKIENNLIVFRDPKLPGGANNIGILILRETADLVFQHNTVMPSPGSSACNAAVYFDAGGKGLPSPPVSLTQNVWILDNILCRQPNGPAGSGTAALNVYMPDPAPLPLRFSGNVMVVGPGEKEQSFPPNNLVTDKELRLPDASSDSRKGFPIWTKTSNGKPAGADRAALEAAIAADSGSKAVPLSSGHPTN